MSASKGTSRAGDDFRRLVVALSNLELSALQRLNSACASMLTVSQRLLVCLSHLETIIDITNCGQQARPLPSCKYALSCDYGAHDLAEAVEDAIATKGHDSDSNASYDFSEDWPRSFRPLYEACLEPLGSRALYSLLLPVSLTMLYYVDAATLIKNADGTNANAIAMSTSLKLALELPSFIGPQGAYTRARQEYREALRELPDAAAGCVMALLCRWWPGSERAYLDSLEAAYSHPTKTKLPDYRLGFVKELLPEAWKLLSETFHAQTGRAMGALVKAVALQKLLLSSKAAAGGVAAPTLAFEPPSSSTAGGTFLAADWSARNAHLTADGGKVDWQHLEATILCDVESAALSRSLSSPLLSLIPLLAGLDKWSRQVGKGTGSGGGDAKLAAAAKELRGCGEELEADIRRSVARDEASLARRVAAYAVDGSNSSGGSAAAAAAVAAGTKAAGPSSFSSSSRLELAKSLKLEPPAVLLELPPSSSASPTPSHASASPPINRHLLTTAGAALISGAAAGATQQPTTSSPSFDRWTVVHYGLPVRCTLNCTQQSLGLPATSTDATQAASEQHKRVLRKLAGRGGLDVVSVAWGFDSMSSEAGTSDSKSGSHVMPLLHRLLVPAAFKLGCSSDSVYEPLTGTASPPACFFQLAADLFSLFDRTPPAQWHLAALLLCLRAGAAALAPVTDALVTSVGPAAVDIDALVQGVIRNQLCVAQEDGAGWSIALSCTFLLGLRLAPFLLCFTPPDDVIAFLDRHAVPSPDLNYALWMPLNAAQFASALAADVVRLVQMFPAAGALVAEVSLVNYCPACGFQMMGQASPGGNNNVSSFAQRMRPLQPCLRLIDGDQSTPAPAPAAAVRLLPAAYADHAFGPGRLSAAQMEVASLVLGTADGPALLALAEQYAASTIPLKGEGGRKADHKDDNDDDASAADAATAGVEDEAISKGVAAAWRELEEMESVLHLVSTAAVSAGMQPTDPDVIILLCRCMQLAHELTSLLMPWENHGQLGYRIATAIALACDVIAPEHEVAAAAALKASCAELAAAAGDDDPGASVCTPALSHRIKSLLVALAPLRSWPAGPSSGTSAGGFNVDELSSSQPVTPKAVAGFLPLLMRWCVAAVAKTSPQLALSLARIMRPPGTSPEFKSGAEGVKLQMTPADMALRYPSLMADMTTTLQVAFSRMRYVAYTLHCAGASTAIPPEMWGNPFIPFIMRQRYVLADPPASSDPPFDITHNASGSSSSGAGAGTPAAAEGDALSITSSSSSSSRSSAMAVQTTLLGDMWKLVECIRQLCFQHRPEGTITPLHAAPAIAALSQLLQQGVTQQAVRGGEVVLLLMRSDAYHALIQYHAHFPALPLCVLAGVVPADVVKTARSKATPGGADTGPGAIFCDSYYRAASKAAVDLCLKLRSTFEPETARLCISITARVLAAIGDSLTGNEGESSVTPFLAHVKPEPEAGRLFSERVGDNPERWVHGVRAVVQYYLHDYAKTQLHVSRSLPGRMTKAEMAQRVQQRGMYYPSLTTLLDAIVRYGWLAASGSHSYRDGRGVQWSPMVGFSPRAQMLLAGAGLRLPPTSTAQPPCTLVLTSAGVERVLISDVCLKAALAGGIASSSGGGSGSSSSSNSAITATTSGAKGSASVAATTGSPSSSSSSSAKAARADVKALLADKKASGSGSDKAIASGTSEDDDDVVLNVEVIRRLHARGLVVATTDGPTQIWQTLRRSFGSNMAYWRRLATVIGDTQLDDCLKRWLPKKVFKQYAAVAPKPFKVDSLPPAFIKDGWAVVTLRPKMAANLRTVALAQCLLQAVRRSQPPEEALPMARDIIVSSLNDTALLHALTSPLVRTSPQEGTALVKLAHDWLVRVDARAETYTSLASTQLPPGVKVMPQVVLWAILSSIGLGSSSNSKTSGSSSSGGSDGAAGGGGGGGGSTGRSVEQMRKDVQTVISLLPQASGKAASGSSSSSDAASTNVIVFWAGEEAASIFSALKMEIQMLESQYVDMPVLEPVGDINDEDDDAAAAAESNASALVSSGSAGAGTTIGGYSSAAVRGAMATFLDTALSLPPGFAVEQANLPRVKTAVASLRVMMDKLPGDDALTALAPGLPKAISTLSYRAEQVKMLSGIIANAAKANAMPKPAYTFDVLQEMVTYMQEAALVCKYVIDDHFASQQEPSTSFAAGADSSSASSPPLLTSPSSSTSALVSGASGAAASAEPAATTTSPSLLASSPSLPPAAVVAGPLELYTRYIPQCVRYVMTGASEKWGPPPPPLAPSSASASSASSSFATDTGEQQLADVTQMLLDSMSSSSSSSSSNNKRQSAPAALQDGKQSGGSREGRGNDAFAQLRRRARVVLAVRYLASRTPQERRRFMIRLFTFPAACIVDQEYLLTLLSEACPVHNPPQGKFPRPKGGGGLTQWCKLTSIPSGCSGTSRPGVMRRTIACMLAPFARYSLQEAQAMADSLLDGYAPDQLHEICRTGHELSVAMKTKEAEKQKEKGTGQKGSSGSGDGRNEKQQESGGAKQVAVSATSSKGLTAALDNGKGGKATAEAKSGSSGTSAGAVSVAASGKGPKGSATASSSPVASAAALSKARAPAAAASSCSASPAAASSSGKPMSAAYKAKLVATVVAPQLRRLMRLWDFLAQRSQQAGQLRLVVVMGRRAARRAAALLTADERARVQRPAEATREALCSGLLGETGGHLLLKSFPRPPGVIISADSLLRMLTLPVLACGMEAWPQAELEAALAPVATALHTFLGNLNRTDEVFHSASGHLLPRSCSCLCHPVLLYLVGATADYNTILGILARSGCPPAFARGYRKLAAPLLEAAGRVVTSCPSAGNVKRRRKLSSLFTSTLAYALVGYQTYARLPIALLLEWLPTMAVDESVAAALTKPAGSAALAVAAAQCATADALARVAAAANAESGGFSDELRQSLETLAKTHSDARSTAQAAAAAAATAAAAASSPTAPSSSAMEELEEEEDLESDVDDELEEASALQDEEEESAPSDSSRSASGQPSRRGSVSNSIPIAASTPLASRPSTPKQEAVQRSVAAGASASSSSVSSRAQQVPAAVSVSAIAGHAAPRLHAATTSAAEMRKQAVPAAGASAVPSSSPIKQQAAAAQSSMNRPGPAYVSRRSDTEATAAAQPSATAAWSQLSAQQTAKPPQPTATLLRPVDVSADMAVTATSGASWKQVVPNSSRSFADLGGRGMPLAVQQQQLTSGSLAQQQPPPVVLDANELEEEEQHATSKAAAASSGSSSGATAADLPSSSSVDQLALATSADALNASGSRLPIAKPTTVASSSSSGGLDLSGQGLRGGDSEASLGKAPASSFFDMPPPPSRDHADALMDDILFAALEDDNDDGAAQGEEGGSSSGSNRYSSALSQLRDGHAWGGSSVIPSFSASAASAPQSASPHMGPTAAQLAALLDEPLGDDDEQSVPSFSSSSSSSSSSALPVPLPPSFVPFADASQQRVSEPQQQAQQFASSNSSNAAIQPSYPPGLGPSSSHSATSDVTPSTNNSSNMIAASEAAAAAQQQQQMQAAAMEVIRQLTAEVTRLRDADAARSAFANQLVAAKEAAQLAADERGVALTEAQAELAKVQLENARQRLQLQHVATEARQASDARAAAEQALADREAQLGASVAASVEAANYFKAEWLRATHELACYFHRYGPPPPPPPHLQPPPPPLPPGHGMGTAAAAHAGANTASPLMTPGGMLSGGPSPAPWSHALPAPQPLPHQQANALPPLPPLPPQLQAFFSQGAGAAAPGNPLGQR